jgi:hypothetical protein
VSALDPRAARERKQKIFVAVGGVALLVLVGIQLPGYLGGDPSPSAAPAAGAEPVREPAATPVAVPGPGGRPPKLRSFTVFSRKDPFVQQVQADPAPAPEGASPEGEKEGAKKEDAQVEPGSTTEFSVGPKETSAVTIVSVNGRRQVLAPGAAFPASDPVFVLVAERPAARAVVVGVKGGRYAGGKETTRLVVGKPLTLVNTTTGARYRLVLVAVGSGEPAPQPEQ